MVSACQWRGLIPAAYPGDELARLRTDRGGREVRAALCKGESPLLALSCGRFLNGPFQKFSSIAALLRLVS